MGQLLPSDPYIYVTPSDEDGFGQLLQLIHSVAQKLGILVFRPDRYATYDLAFYNTDPIVSNALCVISEVNMLDLGQMSILGFARGIRKPVVYVASDLNYVAADLRRHLILTYDLANPAPFVLELSKQIEGIRNSPEDFLKSLNAQNPRPRPKIFISYCHLDRNFLDRLMVHLKPLETEGLIDLWVDTRIRSGDKWKTEIETALSEVSIAIVLVSADYLASDFVISNELPELFKNAEDRGTRIIPVILKPCRFARESSLSRFQAINDPKDPIVLLSDGERERIFDLVAHEVEKWAR